MEKLPAPSINLAKNRGESLTDRVLTFALTIGRILVIITESIALGAFLYRFGLDKQLVDLHNRITQEEAIVNLLKSNETTYRNLQDRITLAGNIAKTAASSENLYQDIFSLLPANMALSDVSLSDTIVHLDGNVPTLVSLSAFVDRLKSDPHINNVSLDKIENNAGQGTISVSITIYIKPEQNQPLL